MGARAKKVGRPDAARAIVDQLEELAAPRKKTFRLSG